MKSWILETLKKFTFFKTKLKRPVIETSEENTPVHLEPWWGTFKIEEEQSRFFKIGDMVVCVDRFSQKWHITTYHEGQQPFKTFAAQTSNEITLQPVLPDRPLLSLLDRPCYIPVKETALIYISVPLWIQISAGHPKTLLNEFATENLADTWFGKNTLEGELCYDNPIPGSPRLDDLPHDLTHAIIPVSIENRSRETILINELKIPLSHLSLYSDTYNQLWTEQLHVYQEDVTRIQTRIVKGSPLPTKDIQVVSSGRIALKPGLKNLFSPFMWK